MGNKINKEREEILKKIEYLEKVGNFNTDVENDPPTKELKPNEIDYLHKKLKTKFLSYIVNKKVDKATKDLIKNHQLIIKNVVGIENLNKIKGSAFITSNHFHPFENIAIYKVFKDNMPCKHKFYRVIREGNYTASPKGFDMFFKYANTLPLSSNIHTMQKFLNAIRTLTKHKTYILMYPEQYMWWNYKKPRPLKDGVYKLAYKNNTPIIPCFITMSDSEFLDSDGLYVQEYTLNILPPIYPNTNKNIKNEIERMKNLNFDLYKNVYEHTYDKKLEYTTESDA